MVDHKKIIYLVIALAGVLLVVELAWAYATLYKPTSSKNITVLPTTTQSQKTKISLVAPKTSLAVGEEVTVVVSISSNVLTDGTDLVINYDPKLIEVVPAPGTQNPITVGSMYSQYPSNKLDKPRGIITVSGISSEKNGTLANGVFGTMIFRAKAIGSAQVTVSYISGATNESNVIETATGKDVLGEVQNLQLVITK